ncbi:D-tyrosyl-tRNA(Tyr) deacylase [Candidatus Roizmanbacteria bacterium]|nr:D-tyrosyl-tRNA(Tyr) deacylase [Candidatus Roizmanbacteria bacterium]
MKIVIQRVKRASVSVNEDVISSINQGLLILLGVGKEDTQDTVRKMAEKIVKLRIMSDEQDKMNKSILDVTGEILVVSQFTLLADTSGGNRPSFINAAPPEKAKELYELFVSEVKRLGVSKVLTGSFGAYMQVELVNDGPVTIVL